MISDYELNELRADMRLLQKDLKKSKQRIKALEKRRKKWNNAADYVFHKTHSSE